MTSPEQHAATVEEWVRSRVSILDGPESRRDKAIAGRAALAELVALAGRADDEPDWQNELRERLEAAEARADELQRERDEAREILDGSHARGYREGVQAEREQARREADQLREQLGAHLARILRALPEDSTEYSVIAARDSAQRLAALAGVQADKGSEGGSNREHLSSAKAAAPPGSEADNKESA